MRLTIDIGNSSSKLALFDRNGQIVERGTLDAFDGWDSVTDVAICISGKADILDGLIPDHISPIIVGSDTPLPIAIDYDTPQTLGADRIAAACGAAARYRGKGCMIVDAGTCVTIDYVDKEGVFRGGAILPGAWMQFAALHNFTASLPLIEQWEENCAPCGRSTAGCMTAGVLWGLRYAIEGYAKYYRESFGELVILNTGGADVSDARTKAELGIINEPDLVMTGLNEIIEHNKHNRGEQKS